MPNLFRLEEDGFQLDLPYQHLKANLPALKLHCFGFINCLCFHTDEIQQDLIDLFRKLRIRAQNGPCSISKKMTIFKRSHFWVTLIYIGKKFWTVPMRPISAKLYVIQHFIH